jgi:hypothetical protein
MRSEDAGTSAAERVTAARAAETTQQPGTRCRRRCGMSAAAALPCIVESSLAAADAGLPVWRPKPVGGVAFYRKHCAGLLRRYMQASMELGRTPCVLGKMVFRGRVSSYRLTTFEDMVIFILDIEKCLKRLDPVSQAVIAHVVLEDYSIVETAAIVGESERSIARIYGAALDRLTRLFLDRRLLEPNSQKLSIVEG